MYGMRRSGARSRHAPANSSARRTGLIRRIARAGMLFAFAMPAAAQQDFMSAPLIKPGEEALVVNLGGILNQFDSRVQINGQRLNGSDIDLEGNGLPHDDWSFQAAASWRFLPRHRIDVQYFSTKRSGTATYERSVTIGDNEYPLGATVSIEAKDQFLLADYRYSFVKNDAIEFAGIIGVYGGRFEFDVNATGTAGTVSASANTTASTTVPLPLIGVAMDWYVNPAGRSPAASRGSRLTSARLMAAPSSQRCRPTTCSYGTSASASATCIPIFRWKCRSRASTERPTGA